MKSFLSVIIALALLFYFSFTALGAVTLPWSTTFDCSEWSCCGSLNCDNLSIGGGWTCSGQPEQITSAANYSGGNGGKGQRHWKGDGQDENSGGTSIYFNKTSELWVRWYMRYPSGFSWAGLTYDKWLYIDRGQSDAVVPEWFGDSSAVFSSGQGYTGLKHSTGWSEIMGGSTGDGQWHLYEVHIKMDTNGSNGVAQLWIDEILLVNNSSVDFGTTSGWESILFGSNQASPNTGGCVPVDYDDIAISRTGYIGPIGGGGGDGIPPSIPRSVEAE